MKTGKYKKNSLYCRIFSSKYNRLCCTCFEMCDSLSKLGYEVELILPYIDKSYKFNKIKDDYLLKKYKMFNI